MMKNLMRNSLMHRNFWYEEVRYKLAQHRWISYDSKNKQVFFDTSAGAKLRMFIVTLILLFFCVSNLHYFYCKKLFLNTFDFLAIVNICGTIVILLYVVWYEKDIRKACYDFIHDLELVDYLLSKSKVLRYGKKNRCVNHGNVIISVTLLICNALCVPAIYLFFVQPSTKVVGVFSLIALYLWPSFVYSTLARRLISDRLSIFEKVLRILSKRHVAELSDK